MSSEAKVAIREEKLNLIRIKFNERKSALESGKR